MTRLATVLCVLGVLLSAPALLVAADPPGEPVWHAVSGAAPGEEARLLEQVSAPASFRARVAVPGFWTATVPTKAGPRSTFEIPGAGIASELGRPKLPVFRYLVEVPPGAAVSAVVEEESARTVALADLGLAAPLLPVQHPVPKIAGAEATIPFVEDAATYAADAPYPASPIAVTGEASLRGRRVALVEVRPVAYNPARGTLAIRDEIAFRVSWSGGDPAAAAREKARASSPALDAALAGAVVNLAPAEPAGPEAARGSAGGAAQGAEGLLVFVNEAFEGAIQPLVEWKRKSGFKVEVIKTSSLGNPATDVQVKNAIQTRYDSWSSPSLGWVLMVGDTDLCPIHQGNGGGSSQVTDNWYACTSGTDYLPDLAISRISTRTAQETSNVVEKLLLHEKATFSTDTWTKEAGFIGTSDSGHISQIEGTHDWCIDTYMTPNAYLETAWSHGKESCDRHYNTYGATTAQISASIDEGRSIVNYSGHGSTDSWQGPTSGGGYDQTDVRANANAGMYPFVISNACLTGKLDVAECFGETWQKVPDKGAIAFWGASNNSYWDEDDYLQRRLYGNLFPIDSTPALAVVVNRTKIDLYNHYGATSTVAYYFDMYNLLSEPTLSLWTRQPRTLAVSYPGSVPIGFGTFEVTATFEGSPVGDALVAVRRETDGVFESGYTDAQGKVTFTLDPGPSTVGAMEVTVTRHDFRPHEGTSQVISPDSAWLDHRSHGVDDSAGGDGDGMANPGETIVMPVTVENVGQQPGTGLAGTLATNTPAWAEVLDAAATFPDLAVDQQGTTLPDHYRIRVKSGTPDGVLLGFDLTWSASGGSSGTTSFSEPVRAVDFAYDHHLVDDTSGGNGNGAAGPGETVDMTVTIANVGHKDASAIHGVLTSASPYVTILEAEADYPDLVAGANGTSLPPAYRFSVAQNAPDNAPVTFNLSLTETGTGYGEVLVFDVLISSCSVADSTDVPKTISDNSTVDSVLSYPREIEIGEVNVFVNIQHTYIGDLEVRLISPSGTTVLLHDNSGGSTDNLVTWYDTETQPVEALSKVNGENSAGTWTLRVADTAGGDTGSLVAWRLEVCGQATAPHPVLSVASYEVDDSGSCDPDGYADVGETATFRVTLQNTGNATATGAEAVLTSSSTIEVLDNPAVVGTLAPSQSAIVEFHVKTGAVACMENASFAVSMAAAEGTWGGAFSAYLETDEATSSSTETVEHAGAEPAGWSHQALQGTDDWHVVSTRNHSSPGSYSWFVSDPNKIKDDALVTPSYSLLPDGTATLTFWHFADLQSGYDGGVLEVSVDGGAWTDMGAHITSGGYDATLAIANPLGNRQAWTGTYTAWKQTTADLSAWAGHSVQFRFRIGCDASTKKVGWWVDDLTVATSGRQCDAHACGVPAEIENARVDKSGGSAVLRWRADVVATSYRVFRAADPSGAGNFSDVTSEDANPQDSTFTDGSAGDAYFIVTGVGPDGEGAWGHFGL